VQILVEDVHRAYRMGDTELPVLRGVSLCVEPGEYVALTGPSGSGKSTLLHLIGCLDQPSAGSYRLGGLAVDTLSDAELSELRNRTIGFVFQAFYLIAELSVRENVEVPLLYRGLAGPERSERALAALESVGLGARVDHHPTQLSGGERQRVAIARAIVGEPSIVLADEPTGNLDSRTGEDVTRLLEGLHDGGATLVIVTHDQRMAERAQRVVKLRDGRIVG
jgi:putative ABC transport system ATP-binding protein